MKDIHLPKKVKEAIDKGSTYEQIIKANKGIGQIALTYVASNGVKGISSITSER